MDFNNILKHARELWKKLPVLQKIAIGTGIFLFVLFIFFLSLHRGGGVEYGVLFSGLESKDASRIVEELKKNSIPYKLGQNGATVLVPKEKVYDLRLFFSGQGLPSMGVVGFEIFDKTNISRTEFTQKIEFRRALEGELVRTIVKLNEIDKARVHLAIPEKSLFIEEEKPVTASVLLQIHPGDQLTPKQVKGIVHLIASAVEGLSPDNITVIDTNGNILSDESMGGTDTNTSETSMKNIELERGFEKKLELRVKTMLERVLGPGNVVVRVRAQLNFDKVKTQKETYNPVSEDKGIVRSSQDIEKIVKTNATNTSSPPGTTSNVTNYPAGAGIPEKKDSSEKNIITNYEINKVQEYIEQAPGSIKKIFVSVIIGKKLKDSELQAIKRSVAAACGITPSRGDEIAVEEVPFDKTYIEQQKKEMEKETKREFTLTIIKLISVLIIFFTLLVIVLYIIKSVRKKKASLEFMLGEESPEGVGPEGGAGIRTEKNKSPEEVRKELIYNEIEKLARENPEELVRVIRNWLIEDER